MRQEVWEKIDLLCRNSEILTEEFGTEESSMYTAASLLAVKQSRELQPDMLRDCRKYFRKHTGMLSAFRGHLSIPVICSMAMQADPEQYYLDIQNLYKRFNSGHLLGWEYHILAAMLLYACMGAGANWTHVYHATELLERMSAEHAFLADQAELPLAVMLILRGRDQEEVLENMEASYRLLQTAFKDANAARLVSHLLSLDDRSPKLKCEGVRGLYEILCRGEKREIGSGELMALALLAKSHGKADQNVKSDPNKRADRNVKTDPGAASVPDALQDPDVGWADPEEAVRELMELERCLQENRKESALPENAGLIRLTASILLSFAEVSEKEKAPDLTAMQEICLLRMIAEASAAASGRK